MKIVMVNPPVWDISTPPINIAYLTAYLKSLGFNVKAFDFSIELYNKLDVKELWGPGYLAMWNEEDRFWNEFNSEIREEIIQYMFDKIMKEKPDFIGFTLNYSPHLVLEISRRIKEVNKKILIVIGGNYSEKHIFGEKLIGSGFIDLAVLGEGEETLGDIAKRFSDNQNLDDIPGTLVLKSEQVIENQRRNKILKPDEIPFPDYSDFDLSLYKNQDTLVPQRKLPLLFSRGCVNNCDFCAQTFIWGKPFVMRSGRNMFLEVKRDYEKYNVKKFQFADLAINWDLRKLNEFCDLIIENGLDIEWGAGAVIRKDMDFKKLKQARCRWLDVGLEAGSNHVIKEMGKHFTMAMALEFFKKASEVDLTVTTSMIVGHPSETLEDFEETLEFIKKASPYLKMGPSVSLCGVYPNTLLHDKMESYGAKPNEDLWMEWKIPKNDYQERLRRLKIMNKIIRKYVDERGLRIPNQEVYHYET